MHRQSASKVSGPPLVSHSTALVSASATLTGSHQITLGPNAIIQLRSHLSSTLGPIDISEDCIIDERASVGLLSPSFPRSQTDNGLILGVSLGRSVLIGPGATVEATSIGDFTVVETGAKIGRGAVIGRNCKICAQMEVREEEVIGDDVVIFGNGWDQRRVDRKSGAVSEMRERWVKEQEQVLRRMWTGK